MGVSLAADAYGRELSYIDNFRGVFEQDVIVPLNATSTIYPESRDMFGWLTVLGFLGVMIATLLKRPRVEPREPTPAPSERALAETGGTRR